ncbi:MAG: bifunctional indole-3-glycerol-phosphate synthase TrpC/phosphoribosylanthranilate isomerase TrpF [Enterobacterales bacterium]
MHDTILNKILEYKYKWVKKNKKLHPINSFIKSINYSKKFFYKSLYKKQKTFILECKKASPSKGIIRDNFNPIEIANIYKKYADVISVLTDEKYFYGSFNFLLNISKVVHQPILCKDFIIDTWQIYWARLHNADAVLLMLSVLDDDTYLKLSNLAHKLKMGILTEVSNIKEIKRAEKLNAKIIDINNHNLHDLSIDINRTIKLAPKISKKIKIISASGINNYRQIKKLSNYVNGFLIGSIFMSKKNINMSICKVLFGENKVCGLTRSIDAQTSLYYGAIYGGLIFINSSPRCIHLKNAKQIIDKTPLHYVGVFKNYNIEQIISIVKELNLKIIQLHGDEDQNYINKLRKKLPINCYIWKAINMKNSLIKLNLHNIDRYILDNGGGSGKTFNWDILKNMNLKKTILSGGLNVYNCVNASNIGSDGLDFNSGVEISPGIKDKKKIKEVFYKIKNY